ncbi:flagellar protein FlaG [Clostridiaceae bacterium M8S5]|nr:flagellar protein FlaG [Clostridiaceae bacterium M8S5]
MKITGSIETNNVNRVQKVTESESKPNINIRLNNTSKEENNIKNSKVQEQDIIHAIEQANKSVIVYDRRLEFSIHDKTKQIMVKVIDTVKDEVIREIPAEKTLDMVAKFLEVAGILVDEKI